MKAGKKVHVNGCSFTWPTENAAKDAFMASFSKAFFYDLAKNPDNVPVLRGMAMSRCISLCPLDTESGGLCKDVQKKLTSNCRSLLLTYQGSWGVLSWLTPRPTANVDDVVRLVRLDPAAKTLFAEAVAFFTSFRETGWFTQFAVALELCTTTWELKNVVRVHLHLWLLKSRASPLLTDLKWHGSLPYSNAKAAEYFGGRGSRSASAAYSGAFYIQVEKIGVIWTEGTVTPYSSYSVKDFWITGLLHGEKISFDTARYHYLKCIVRAEANIRQAEYVQRAMHEIVAAREKELFEEQIVQQQRKFKVLQPVLAWATQYQRTLDRYLFLVLDGPSRTGKTRFAYSLLDQLVRTSTPEMSLGTSTPPSRSSIYYADCSGGLPDLRGFKRSQHCLLILDEIAPKTAVYLKKSMQASNDDALLGSSPTMQHCYKLNTFRTAIVVTTNTWATGLCGMPVPDVDWLKANSVYVFVNEPLYEQD
jgi:hypothetical protein